MTAESTYDNHLPETAKEQLTRIIEAWERLDEERKAIASDQKDKMAEAQALGFDVKTVRKVIALRKKSREERAEEDAITAVYLHALGMIDEVEMEAAAQPMARKPTKRVPLKRRRAGDDPERKAENGYQVDS